MAGEVEARSAGRAALACLDRVGTVPVTQASPRKHAAHTFPFGTKEGDGRTSNLP
jgi:hypothetical protein